jgi:hypothetical protein
VPTLKLELNQETYGRLVVEADAERRPVNWQAEVTLRRALGLPFPPASEKSTHGHPRSEAAS